MWRDDFLFSSSTFSFYRIFEDFRCQQQKSTDICENRQYAYTSGYEIIYISLVQTKKIVTFFFSFKSFMPFSITLSLVICQYDNFCKGTSPQNILFLDAQHSSVASNFGYSENVNKFQKIMWSKSFCSKISQVKF